MLSKTSIDLPKLFIYANTKIKLNLRGNAESWSKSKKKHQLLFQSSRINQMFQWILELKIIPTQAGLRGLRKLLRWIMLTD